MKHSKPLWALILVMIVLLFGAAHPSAGDQPIAADKPKTYTVDKPYNYSGTFNYIAPSNPVPPEGRWKVAGEIATVCSAIFFLIFASLLWGIDRKQKRMAEAAAVIARQGPELATLMAGLLRDFGATQQNTAATAERIARHSGELTTLVVALLKEFVLGQKEIAGAAEASARQSAEVTKLMADLLGEFTRGRKETAEASQAASRQNIELTAQVAGLLKEFGLRQRETAEAAATVARQSVELKELARDAERPYLSVEGQEIEISVAAPTTLAARTISENIALEPMSYALAGASNDANLTLSFTLRNRGKGIAVVRRIRVRMLLGNGAHNNGASKLATLGTRDGTIRTRVIAGGEKAECYCFGLTLPLRTLDEIRQFNSLLRFVVVVNHADVFKRPLVTTFPLEYRPPIRSLGFNGSPDYPSMLLPMLRDGRMPRRRSQ